MIVLVLMFIRPLTLKLPFAFLAVELAAEKGLSILNSSYTLILDF
jgi:hypothetical protein